MRKGRARPAIGCHSPSAVRRQTDRPKETNSDPSGSGTTFDAQLVRRIWERHVMGVADLSAWLWPIAMLQAWIAETETGRPAPARSRRCACRWRRRRETPCAISIPTGSRGSGSQSSNRARKPEAERDAIHATIAASQGRPGHRNTAGLLHSETIKKFSGYRALLEVSAAWARPPIAATGGRSFRVWKHNQGTSKGCRC